MISRSTLRPASLAVLAALAVAFPTACADDPASERSTSATQPDATGPAISTDVPNATEPLSARPTSADSAPTASDAGTAPATSRPTTTPPTVPPTLPPPPMPVESSLGPAPSVVLHDLPAENVRFGKRYARVRVIGSLQFGAGLPASSFTSCRIEGTIVTYSPLILHECVVTGGVYGYDTGGEITKSLLTGDGQAFRPGTTRMEDGLTTPTPWTVEDTIIRIGPGIPPAHVEATQVLGGVGLTFRNVVFESGGPFNNTQTSDFSFFGKNLLCEDCWFVGFGGYAIYASGVDNVFVRPRFGRNSAFGLLYPSEPGLEPRIIDPYYIDGTPVTATG